MFPPPSDWSEADHFYRTDAKVLELQGRTDANLLELQTGGVQGCSADSEDSVSTRGENDGWAEWTFFRQEQDALFRQELERQELLQSVRPETSTCCGETRLGVLAERGVEKIPSSFPFYSYERVDVIQKFFLQQFFGGALSSPNSTGFLEEEDHPDHRSWIEEEGPPDRSWILGSPPGSRVPAEPTGEFVPGSGVPLRRGGGGRRAGRAGEAVVQGCGELGVLQDGGAAATGEFLQELGVLQDGGAAATGELLQELGVLQDGGAAATGECFVPSFLDRSWIGRRSFPDWESLLARLVESADYDPDLPAPLRALLQDSSLHEDGRLRDASSHMHNGFSEAHAHSEHQRSTSSNDVLRRCSTADMRSHDSNDMRSHDKQLC